MGWHRMLPFSSPASVCDLLTFAISLWIFLQLFLGTPSHGMWLDTSALAHGLWYVGCSPQEELTPGSLSTHRHPGQSTSPRLHHFSALDTLSFLCCLSHSYIFPPLGNETFLTSVTSNAQRAQKNFWVGGSLYCTAPCLPVSRRFPRDPLPLWAVHRM